MWMMQPRLVDLSDISNMQYQAELTELQNDDSVKTLFSIKGAIAWLCEETEIKYPNSPKCARKLRLDITQRGDLRLKLTKLEPNIKSLCSKHQEQGSH
ncbi:uncharacterized protein TNCV_4162101 [Trichonephila clavipes]|nr:uncharacterized protein TNCV_4162101 [Trichonephila clavipes]